MIRSTVMTAYDFTARYGNLRVHRETVVTNGGGLDSQAERIYNIAKQVLDNRNVPLFHEDIYVYAVIRDRQMQYIFKRFNKTEKNEELSTNG